MRCCLMSIRRFCVVSALIPLALAISSQATARSGEPPSSVPAQAPPSFVPAHGPPSFIPGSGPPRSVSALVVDTPEMVFDWTTDRCEDTDFPDLPVRAFRDANERVQLVGGHPPRYYRWIGEDLDTVVRDCSEPVLRSDLDIDPSQYDFKEWIGSLYTVDGMNINALVHSEFHGWEASRWFAEFDFSGVQGEDNWRYEAWAEFPGLSFTDMTYNSATNRWEGSHDLCVLGTRFAHPAPGCDAVRAWISPVAETVTVSGDVFDLDDGGGDGVKVIIAKSGTVLWSKVVENGETDPLHFELDVDVVPGDRLLFRVNQRANPGFDTTFFNPKINMGPDPCPSDSRGPGGLCHHVAVTFARSTDGGATYDHIQSPPDHLVANPPVRYEPDGGDHSIWQPSNIVRHPDDSYYYALIQRDEHPADGSVNIQGTCVMRTETPSDPDTWRAWDGHGFNLRFVDPYKEPVPDPDSSWCETVSVGEIGALTYGLSYNKYLRKFVAVGVASAGVSVPGFYFSVSEDLIHWEPKQLLMEAVLAQTAEPSEPFFAYPTFIDPADSTINFERPGKRPYLYFTRFNNTGSPTDADLLRVRVAFTKRGL